MKRFSLAVVIIHHGSKIPSRKVNTADSRHVTLTGHFVAWNENGCTESSKIFCRKVLQNWSIMWCKKQSSDVISSSLLLNTMSAPRTSDIQIGSPVNYHARRLALQGQRLDFFCPIMMMAAKHGLSKKKKKQLTSKRKNAQKSNGEEHVGSKATR